MREMLSWVKTFLKSDSSFRKKVRTSVLKQLEYEGSGDESTPSKERLKQGKILSRLVSQSNMKFIGVMPNISYLKVEGDKKDELPYAWVHPFGNPALLYYDKNSGALLIVGNGIKFNDSVVNEYPENKKVSMIGITG
jgi:hypothetical protein